MTHKILDRAREATATVGLGNLTLLGPSSSEYKSVTSGLVDGDTSWYCADAGQEWEIFLGTRVSSTQLARTTLLDSSNGGLPVSFTAPPVVYSTVPGAALISYAAPAFRAYLSADQTGIVSATFTKMLLNTKEFDTNNCFDTSLSRFTPNIPGYYMFEWLMLGNGASITTSSAVLRKNGSLDVADSVYFPLSSTHQRVVGTRLIYLTTSDYIEVFGYLVGTTLKFVSGLKETSLSGHFVRA